MKILYILSDKQYQGGQVVNKVGKYLYNNIDGAFKFKKSPNMYDIWFTLLYQIPSEQLTDKEKHDVKVNEITINLNIATYNDKIRINVIVDDEFEKTLGTKTFSYEKSNNLEKLRDDVLSFVQKKLTKEYEDYDFYF